MPMVSLCTYSIYGHTSTEALSSDELNSLLHTAVLAPEASYMHVMTGCIIEQLRHPRFFGSFVGTAEEHVLLLYGSIVVERVNALLPFAVVLKRLIANLVFYTACEGIYRGCKGSGFMAVLFL